MNHDKLHLSNPTREVEHFVIVRSGRTVSSLPPRWQEIQRSCDRGVTLSSTSWRKMSRGAGRP
jgi:hypothetical protein